MKQLLKTLNFKTVDIYGAKLGAFSRNDKLSTEDFEMLIIAEIQWRAIGRAWYGLINLPRCAAKSIFPQNIIRGKKQPGKLIMHP